MARFRAQNGEGGRLAKGPRGQCASGEAQRWLDVPRCTKFGTGTMRSDFAEQRRGKGPLGPAVHACCWQYLPGWYCINVVVKKTLGPGLLGVWQVGAARGSNSSPLTPAAPVTPDLTVIHESSDKLVDEQQMHSL